MKDRVLFVDDEESILRGIKLNLGRTFDVKVANGPHEAIEIINEQGHFPVVVSDMRMPKIDGATLLRTIKESNPDTKCILLTGHADFEFGGAEAVQSGLLFKILNKPCPRINSGQPYKPHSIPKEMTRQRKKPLILYSNLGL